MQGGALLGGFAACPLFVIKTRMQMVAGEAPCSTHHPVAQALRGIYKDQGVTGFYRGFFQAIPIIVAGTAVRSIWSEVLLNDCQG